MSEIAAPIRVEIWSDVQCPWCYIGKRRFESALERFDGDVEFEYRSFELAPDTPVDFEGTSADYLQQRKGLGREQVQEMLDRVTGIAAGEGLEYRFDDVHQTNTVLAHELLHFAKANGLQHELKERLLLAYFTEGRHIGRVDDLVELAAEVGLDADDARAALESHVHLADVKADVAQAVEYGIQGVPFFVVDGRYGVSGAQESDTFVRVLEQVRDEREAAA